MISSRRKKFVALILMSVCIAGLLIFVMGLHDYIPQVRASAESPDGELKVVVYQVRLSPRPFFPRMGAIAKVYDRQGNLVYQKTIFDDDDWDDTLGDSYKEVVFSGDEIHIRPGAYIQSQVYVIKRSDLRAGK